MYICLHICTHTHIHTPPLSLEDKNKEYMVPHQRARKYYNNLGISDLLSQ